jgi:hypothetical protein
MVNWDRDFPNLSNENREKLKKMYERARSEKQRASLLRSAREMNIDRAMKKAGANASGVIRFSNTSSSTFRQERAQETRRRRANAVKRTAKRAVNVVRAKMPTTEQILDLGWRLGKNIYDNPRGVEMFSEIMGLLALRRKNVPQKIVEATRRALPPLDVLAENTSKRLQRVYGMRSSFIGDIIKFDALLHSDDITKFVSESFVFLMTFGIVLRLLVLGTDRSRKMVTDVLDMVVSVMKLPGFTFYTLSVQTLLNSIVAMHVRLFLAKITNVVVNKYVPSFLSTIIKNVVDWANNKVNLSKYGGKLGTRLVVALLAAITDMKYAPKSIVKQSYKAIDMLMLKPAPRPAITSRNRTPNSSRNERVAESPLRPPRATVSGEGVSSPMRVTATGNNGAKYIFSQRQWNALSNNNRIATSSNDRVVRLTHKGQVRYARRSQLLRD